MKRSVTAEVISGFFAVLFLVAATAKIIDHHNFREQLQSLNLIKPYAVFISWFIPVSELITVGLLLFQTTRITGLCCTLSLMIVFCGHMGFVLMDKLHRHSFPRSTLLLSALSWEMHFWLNLALTVLAAVGTLFQLKILV